jgi:RNA-binding protein YlmH
MKKYDEDDIKLKNVYNQALKDQASFWTPFFDPHQQKQLASALTKQRVEHSFFGGYEGAERKMLFVRASWDAEQPEDPLRVLTLNIPPDATHRDVLGALLATGIKRDQVGDILVTNGKAHVFILETMANYIRTNVERIRQVEAHPMIQPVGAVELPTPSFQVEDWVLTSLRLDNVVAKACRLSRTEAAVHITKGFVKVDHQVMEKGTVQLEDGALVSIRGFGRFVFRITEGMTRKGNHRAQVHWYR